MHDPTAQYGFINAKLRARIGLMRQSSLIDDLLKAKSIVEAVAVLRDSDYAAVAEVYDRTGDIQQMELVLLHGEIEMYRTVSRYLSGEPAAFVMTLLGKIEEDNLKNIVRLWFSGNVRHHPIGYRSEYIFKERILSPVDWTALINATRWEELVATLEKTPYGDVAARFSQDTIRRNGLFDFEVLLDRQWYMTLMEHAARLSPSDRAMVDRIYKVDMDLTNILILVRFGWYHTMDKKKLASLLLPWGKVYKSDEVEAYMGKERNSRDPYALLNRFYPDLAKRMHEDTKKRTEAIHATNSVADQTLRIERYLDERRKQEYNALLASDPFSIGVVMAYFFLYRSEDAMIRAALNGKYYGYDAHYIRGVFE